MPSCGNQSSCASAGQPDPNLIQAAAVQVWPRPDLDDILDQRWNASTIKPIHICADRSATIPGRPD